MVDRTRRNALRVAGALLTGGVAGCIGAESGSHATGESSTGMRGRLPSASTPFESLSRRGPGSDMIVYTDPGTVDHHDTQFVLNEADAEALTVDLANPTPVRAFLTETDFTSASVVIEQRTIEDCYERRLLAVDATEDRFRSWYCQQLRPPTARCAADTEVMVANIIRVQHVYEEPPSSRASSERRGCPAEGGEDQT